MAHGMKLRDKQLGLSMGWHGKTEVMDSIPGFWFEILREPFQFRGKDVPGWSLLVDSITGEMIGKPVADTFQYLANSRWIETVNNALTFMEGAKIASLGTYDDLAKRYVSVEIGDRVKYAIGARGFVDYLNFQGAIDGSMADIVKGSNTCIVCQNTFNYSLFDGAQVHGKAKHTKNHEDKWEGIEKALEAFYNRSGEFRRLMESAEETVMTQDRAKNIFAGWVGSGDEISPRTLGTVNRVADLFVNGKGNRGATGLDLISAVTDYYTHESAGGEDVMKQVTSSEIGAGAKDKESFMLDVRTKNFTFNRQAVASLAKSGETSLAKSES